MLFAIREQRTSLVLKPQDFLVILKLVAIQAGSRSHWASEPVVPGIEGRRASGDEATGPDHDAGTEWTYRSLSDSLAISASEINAAIRRALKSRLLVKLTDDAHPIPRADAIREFAIHGVKYAFPAERGEPTRGIPTAFAAPVFQNRIAISQDLPPVWPYSKGSIRGYALSPIYRAVPIAATNDPILYDLLAALDGIREGRARERELSAQILNSLIK